MPPPRKFEASDKWHIRPDLIVQLQKDVIVPAQAADRLKETIGLLAGGHGGHDRHHPRGRPARCSRLAYGRAFHHPLSPMCMNYSPR